MKFGLLSSQLLVWWSLLFHPVVADEVARQLLDRMSSSHTSLNYEGILVFGNGTDWNTLSIQHSVIEGVEHERLVHLTGEPRECIRRHHAIYCRHPSDHAVNLERGLGNPLVQSLALGKRRLSDVYSIAALSTQRIAGRLAQRVDVLPKQRDRYGYRLWLDTETSLLLRSDLVSDQGQVLERFQFAQVAIGEQLPPSLFIPDAQAHQVGIHPSLDHSLKMTEALTVGNRQWMPNWLPQGFEFAGGHPIVGPLGEQPVMMTFSDGLAALTIFVERAETGNVGELSRQRGATAAVVRSMTYADSYARITAVGELPAQTLERVVRSIQAAN